MSKFDFLLPSTIILALLYFIYWFMVIRKRPKPGVYVWANNTWTLMEERPHEIELIRHEYGFISGTELPKIGTVGQLFYLKRKLNGFS